MKLKKRLLLALPTLIFLCSAYMVLTSLSPFAFNVQFPSSRFSRSDHVYDHKWDACAIPTDIQTLCSVNATKPTAQTPCSLEELSQDCTALREVHGYDDKSISEEEITFPLAFGIKIHTALEQAEQLLRTIYRPHNVYCIHVDKKVDDAVFRVIKSIASCFPNVILSDRINFVYGGFDAVRAELRTMVCALESSVQWKYYLNLAGQEFPLKTNLEMVRILRLLNGTNDIESFPMPQGHRDRYDVEHVVSNGKVVRTSRHKPAPPFNATIRKGSQYSAFSRPFVAAVLYDDVAQDVLNYFKDTRNADESIWSTINQLAWIPGGYTVNVLHTPNNEHISRAVVWKGVDPHKCKGKYVRSVCIFTQEDLPWLLQQPNLFANKFYQDFDSRPAACLEATLNGRVKSRDVVLDMSYYLNLPHVRKESRKSTAGTADGTTNVTQS